VAHVDFLLLRLVMSRMRQSAGRTTSRLFAACDSSSFIRVNQVGYLPEAPKVAVLCTLDSSVVESFRVVDHDGRVVLGPRRITNDGPFGPCRVTQRLDFSSVRRPGRYSILAGRASAVTVRIAADAYRGGADTALYYRRQQRSGWNRFSATRCTASTATSSTTRAAS
jgi:endoglucanase